MNLLIVYIPVSDYHTIQYTVHEYLPNMITLMYRTWYTAANDHDVLTSLTLSEILPSLDGTGKLHYWTNPEVAHR